MNFWKRVRDRAVLNRMEDEAFHAAAAEEAEVGPRRPGLWAKASIEAGGDEARTRAAYLRLLVVALRDEHYVASRTFQEFARPGSVEHVPASATRTSGPPAQAMFDRHVETIRSGRPMITTYQDLSRALGGSIEPQGLFFGMHYRIVHNGKTFRVDNFDDLRDFYLKTVIPSVA